MITRDKVVNEYILPAVKQMWNEKICGEIEEILKQGVIDPEAEETAYKALMQLKKYLKGKKNYEKTEINVLALLRIILALEGMFKRK